MNRSLLKSLSVFLLLASIGSACSDDDAPEFPTSTQLFYSLVGKQAAFSALANNTTAYEWDFGDGAKSTERNPVHVYTGSGFYTVILKVSGATGTDADTAELAVDINPYVLLTGGATDTDGKTWKMDASHPNDKFAKANAELESEIDLTSGILGSIGIAEVYDDEFTFFYDGGYKHDVKADHASFAGYVNQMILNGGTNIVSVGNGAAGYGLCTAGYTPEDNATFTYTEGEDYDVPSEYGASGIVTFKGANTFTFSGTEFIGILDVNRKVIIQELTNTSMRLVIFVSAKPGSYPKASHALVATFKAI